MRKLITILITLHALLLTLHEATAQIINIPGDYPSIQQGINAASDGDTVLVQPDIYNEHLNFLGKAITVGSLFLTTQDTSYISQTVLTGTSSDTTIITFQNDETPQSQLIGFRITNGITQWGNGIMCMGSSPTLMHLRLDGTTYENVFSAIYCNNAECILEDISISDTQGWWAMRLLQSNIIMNNFEIFGNSATGIYVDQGNLTLINGIIANNSTGIYCQNTSLTLEGTTIKCNGKGISSTNSEIEFDDANRCNIFNNSYGTGLGNDISSDSPIHLVLDTFSVTIPTSYYFTPVNTSTFDILNGKNTQVEADIYVSPLGSDTNSGLSENDPFQTIRHASMSILSDSLHPRTIHLLEGTYSKSSNNEILPAVLFDYISLKGVSQESVTLDGEDSAKLIFMSGARDILISGMTVTNGWGIYAQNSTLEIEEMAIMNNSQIIGGGIWLDNTTGTLKNVFLENNRALMGGALYAQNSTITMENSTLAYNYADWYGGGVSFSSTYANFEGIKILENEADLFGGGVYMEDSDPHFNRMIIAGNSAPDTSNWNEGFGGGVYCVRSNPVFQNTLFLGNSAQQDGSVMQCNEGSHAWISNSTIADNAQGLIGWYGPALISCEGSNSQIEILNSILYDNDSVGYTYLRGDITINHSNVEWHAGQVWNGEGNINEDPLFEDSGEHPYQLSAGSPCIDAGNPDTTGLSLPMWDMMGNYRLWDGDGDGDTIVDMGAYEFGSVGVNLPEFNTQHSTFNISCYPNPFSEIAHIEFEIPNPCPVSIQVFNAVGAMVAELPGGVLSEGKRQITWNATDMPAGMYFCKVQMGQEVVMKKIVKL